MKINSQRLNQNHYNWFLCYTGSMKLAQLEYSTMQLFINKTHKLNAKVRTLRDRVTKCKSENNKGMAPPALTSNH